jgi:hypothetical protein
MNPDLEILKAALISTGDDEALARVRESASAIRTALAKEDIDLDIDEFSGLDAHPEWVGRVYSALGGDDEGDAGSEVAQAIQQVRADEAAEIGQAFAGLMELLAECHYDWKELFRPIRYPDPDGPARQRLLNEPSVIAAGRHGYQLMSHTGLTPAIIYEATRGLHLLFDRVVESMEERPPQARLRMQRNADGTALRVIAGESAVSVPHDLVLAEIAGTPDIPEDAVDSLTTWLTDVVRRFQPFLIEGYRYSMEQDGFEKLSGPDLDLPQDLVALWSRPERRIDERRIASRTWPGTTRRRSFDHSN